MSFLTDVSICFDLDGTLVDTAPDLVRVTNEVIALEGLSETDYGKARLDVGYGSYALIRNAFARADHAVADARVDELRAHFLTSYENNIDALSQPYPGVLDVLKDLRRAGARLSVCTNKPGYLARPLMDALDMSRYFERIVGSDDVERNKPYADHIYAAAGHRKRRPIVMIGDSLPDVLSARAAKVPVIVMAYGYSPIPVVKLGADRILRSFRELPSALNEVLS